MSLFLQIIYFIVLTLIIVGISKYILVELLRKLAETLNLKPNTVGNIAGVATSVPELLTVSFSAASGLVATSISNILSSNIINLILYTSSIILNKNIKVLKNRALKIDLFIVLFTILIPIVIIFINVEANISIVPLFLLLFCFCYYINGNAHKLYLKNEEDIINSEIEKEEKHLKGKRKKTAIYSIGLLVTAILLFFVGNALSRSTRKFMFRV